MRFCEPGAMESADDEAKNKKQQLSMFWNRCSRQPRWFFIILKAIFVAAIISVAQWLICCQLKYCSVSYLNPLVGWETNQFIFRLHSTACFPVQAIHRAVVEVASVTFCQLRICMKREQFCFRNKSRGEVFSKSGWAFWGAYSYY